MVGFGRNMACERVGQDFVNEVLWGEIIRLPSKMKQGVPKNLCYISLVTQELFGSLVSDNERFQVFRAQGAGESAFHLDSSQHTTVKLPFRSGFV